MRATPEYVSMREFPRSSTTHSSDTESAENDSSSVPSLNSFNGIRPNQVNTISTPYVSMCRPYVSMNALIERGREHEQVH